MEKTLPLDLMQRKAIEGNISHLSLPGLLLADQRLVLNLEIRTLSLLTDGPTLIMEHQFSINEIRMLVLLLEFYPCYCPYEMLLAYISSNVVTEASIAHCRQCLQEAHSRGTWQQELRPIRRVLSSLRSKLDHFDLGISNVRESGCSLVSLKSHIPSR
jgi:hypothetical protein